MVKIGTVHCGLRFYCYTHSLTQEDGIVASASLGSKLQKHVMSSGVGIARFSHFFDVGDNPVRIRLQQPSKNYAKPQF